MKAHTLINKQTLEQTQQRIAGRMRVVPAMAVMVLLFAVAMAGDENPYDVLGVARDATEADIKSRFHKMALHFHPDRWVLLVTDVDDDH